MRTLWTLAIGAGIALGATHIDMETIRSVVSALPSLGDDPWLMTKRAMWVTLAVGGLVGLVRTSRSTKNGPPEHGNEEGWVAAQLVAGVGGFVAALAGIAGIASS